MARAPRRAREFTSRPARRTNAVPLIGLYGQSGSGKTFTALLMARGIVGQKGRVVLVDTEPGRGDAFADEIPGGYEVVPFHAPPYGPLDYIDAIDEALRKASVGTWGNDLITLGAAINHDFRRKRLTRVVHVWKPKRPEPRERTLSRAEVAKLIRAARASWWARDHLPRFILLAYYLAARKEAVLSLRWTQVDLENGFVDLNPPGRERTSKGRPMLRVPNRLLRLLRAWRKKGAATGFVITHHGHPVKDVRKAFKLAVEKAELGPKVTPHTLRHTSATHMAMGGVPLKVISLYLGHTNVAITERVYAKYSPEYLEAATRFFDRR